MIALTNATVLHRAPEVDLSLESNGCVTVHLHGTSQMFGPDALALLDVFAFGCNVREAFEQLQPRLVGVGAVDNMLLTMSDLVEHGILRVGDRAAATSARPYPFGLYDNPGVQIRILSDRARRTAYIAAVSKVVRPDDVVLDLGTGSGILAIAAARAGARHVYAIEPTNMAAYARSIFLANAVADRITILEGWSETISLPQRADVLCHDLIGSEPLEMNVLEAVRDACSRHLTPDARLVPHSVGFSVVAVEIPDSLARDYAYTDDQIDEWFQHYQIDFSPLRSHASPYAVPVYLRPSEAAALHHVSAPSPLWAIDLRTGTRPRTSWQVSLEMTDHAEHIGLIGMTRIELDESSVFVTNPHAAGDAPHWMVPAWITQQPLAAKKGQSVQVVYEYAGRGRSLVSINTEN